MRQEVIQVTGRGNYILNSYMNNFVNTGVREARLHTYHHMVLAVLQGEGMLWNRRYIVSKAQWPLATSMVQLQTEGGWRSRPLKGGRT